MFSCMDSRTLSTLFFPVRTAYFTHFLTRISHVSSLFPVSYIVCPSTLRPFEIRILQICTAHFRHPAAHFQKKKLPRNTCSACGYAREDTYTSKPKAGSNASGNLSDLQIVLSSLDILALLVCHCTGSLTSGLAGSLTFAAARAACRIL